MILQVILKLLPILLLLGASVVMFSTQKIFQNIKMYQLCLQSSSMESQICAKVIRSVSNDSTLLMQPYKVKKCNFYAFWLVSDDLKTCPYVEFCSIFSLQALLKNFLCLKSIHIRYLKGPPGSGLYNGNKIMVIQRTNPFLLKETFIPPLNAGFGNHFFKYEFISLVGYRIDSLSVRL